MGLDAVEIVMKVEEAFGITISDAEAEKIITVGDFHNTVWKHLMSVPVSTCRSQAIFYRLREAAMETFSVDRHVFSLKANPNAIFPADNRRAAYQKLSHLTGLKFPKLRLPVPWRAFLFLSWLGLTIAAFILLYHLARKSGISNWLLLLASLMLFPAMWLSRILEPKRTAIEQQSLRSFVEAVLVLNYASLGKESGHNRKEMEAIINYIIADHSGNDIADVTPEKRIVADLRIE